MKTKLTWEKLETLLPLLKPETLEQAAGLRRKKIYDVKYGRASMTEEELEKIRCVLEVFK